MRETPVMFRCGGEPLVGMLHRPRGRGRFPAVVFLHGFTGNKSEAHRIFVKMARALSDAGIGSLRFDYRGSGDSGGEFSEMTLASLRQDARRAVTYLRAQSWVDRERIGLLGMSMGGMIGSYTLASDPAIRSLVMWCPVSDPPRHVNRRLDSRARRQLKEMGVVDYGGWAIGKRFLEDMGKADPVKAAAKIRCPVLIVHGSDDAPVPVDSSLAYSRVFKKSGLMHERLVIPGADHVFSSLGWEAEVIGCSLMWLTLTLR